MAFIYNHVTLKKTLPLTIFPHLHAARHNSRGGLIVSGKAETEKQ
jgi:hypothetical protein